MYLFPKSSKFLLALLLSAAVAGSTGCEGEAGNCSEQDDLSQDETCG